MTTTRVLTSWTATRLDTMERFERLYKWRCTDSPWWRWMFRYYSKFASIEKSVCSRRWYKSTISLSGVHLKNVLFGFFFIKMLCERRQKLSINDAHAWKSLFHWFLWVFMSHSVVFEAATSPHCSQHVEARFESKHETRTSYKVSEHLTATINECSTPIDRCKGTQAHSTLSS